MLDVPAVPDLAEAVASLGFPVYLSGMARGLLGRRSIPCRRGIGDGSTLREADLVLLAGVPCDFRLDYGRHIGRGDGSHLGQPKPSGADGGIAVRSWE